MCNKLSLEGAGMGWWGPRALPIFGFIEKAPGLGLNVGVYIHQKWVCICHVSRIRRTIANSRTKFNYEF